MLRTAFVVNLCICECFVFFFFLLLYFVTKNINADESFCTVLQLIFAMQAAWRRVCEAAEPEVTKTRVNIYEAFSHQIFDNR